jgi:hypothetical protein
VGFEFESAAIEPDNFAGNSIAVGKGYDVGATLTTQGRTKRQDQCEG